MRNRSYTFRRRKIATAFGLALGVGIFVCAGSTAAQISATVGSPSSEEPKPMHLLVGRSVILTAPASIRRVSVADPNIVDVLVLSPTQILVNAKAPGGVSLVLWEATGESTTYEFDVDLDVSGLNQRIQQAFPNDQVHLEAASDVVMLSGNAVSGEEADKIYQSVATVIPKTVNLLKVPAPPAKSQILLEVKFAEVDRSALTNLGFTLISVPGTTTRTLAVTGTQQFGAVGVTPGASQTGENNPSAGLNQSTLSLSNLGNLFIFRPDVNLAAAITALQEKNVLQILAEPNLLTESGKEADFLSGGEFPVPVVQGGAVGSAPTVTIMYKPFGVSLKFTPELMENGMIHLKVFPEVSALDFTDAVTISGFLVPAISTRRAEVQVALRDGQTFAIAGLDDNRVTNVYEKVPVLGSVPLLGALFRSESKNRSNTELLVVVTPHIVAPIPQDAPVPGLQYPEPFMPPLAPGMPQNPARK